MSKRVYWESLKKWANENRAKLGGLSSLISVLFVYLVLTGAITITGYSEDSVCAGTVESPCVAYVNFTANEDVFLYPMNYDPYMRNIPFYVDQPVKSWKLYRSGDRDWETLSSL